MKPLEKAMHKKRAKQTKNVKKLMTSDDAYSPEKRMIKIEKRTPSGGTGMVKMTTDWSNLKDETSKAKKHFTKKVGSPTSVQVLGPKDVDKRRIRRILKPLRAKHGLGSLVRKVITKIKPKPKPGAVKDVNVDKLLKNLGDEIKAAPLPPQLKKSLDKLKKAYPHKKARGGRIGLQHGSRPRPSGPHTWVRSGGAVLKGKKVGIQIK